MKSNKKNAAWAAVLASILTVSSISAVAMAETNESKITINASKGINEPPTMTDDAALATYKSNLANYSFSNPTVGADGSYTLTVDVKADEMVGNEEIGTAGQNVLVVLELGGIGDSYTITRTKDAGTADTTELDDDSWKSDASTFVATPDNTKEYFTLWFTVTDDRIANGLEYEISTTDDNGDPVTATLKIEFNDTSDSGSQPVTGIDSTKLAADKTAVEGALKALTVTNETTVTDIQDAIDKLTLNYTATATISKTDATTSEAGSITVTVTYSEGKDTETQTVALTIEKTGSGSVNPPAGGEGEDGKGEGDGEDGEGGDGEIDVDGDLTGDLDVKDAPISASDNAINAEVSINVSAGVVSKDGTTGISIVVNEEDSTVAKFVATPPAKTTDVLNWINDTVTTEEAGKIKELQDALNAVADGKAFVLNFDVLDSEDNSVALTKPVKVTVPVAENLLPNINDIKVYHVTADGLVLIESTVDEDNNIVFETTGFSPFIFSVEDLLTTAPAGDDDGEGDKEPINTGIALAVIPVVIAGAAVVVAARKKKNG